MFLDFTYGMLWLINKFTVVRTTQVEEEKGLDSLCMANAYVMEGNKKQFFVETGFS